MRTTSRFRLALFMGAVLPALALADRPSTNNPLQFISQLGAMAFTQGGGAFLPLTVLQSMRSGQVSLIQQYVLVNSMMNQCLKDVKKYTPKPRDPFQVARSKFQYGLCRLQRCQQQGMLLLSLPLLSNNPYAGGSQDSGDRAANGVFVAALAQGSQGASSCGGQGPAIDPALIQLLLQ